MIKPSVVSKIIGGIGALAVLYADYGQSLVSVLPESIGRHVIAAGAIIAWIASSPFVRSEKLDAKVNKQ